MGRSLLEIAGHGREDASGDTGERIGNRRSPVGYSGTDMADIAVKTLTTLVGKVPLTQSSYC